MSDAFSDMRRHRLPTETYPVYGVRKVKTAIIYIQAAQEALDHALELDEWSRAWPTPEIRDIRRKLDTAIAMAEEIVGK